MNKFFQKIIDRDKTPKSEASKELNKYFTISAVCLFLGLFVAQFFVIAAAGAGARSLVLSYNEGNKKLSNLKMYKIGSILLLTLPFVILLAV